MEKNKPQAKAQPQPQPQLQADEEFGMTKKEALDILLKNVAESRAQFARGEYYTHEEAWAMIKRH